MAIRLQPEAAGGGEVRAWRPVAMWRGIMNWLGFLLELLLQILKGTPSFAQMLLSYLAQPRFLSSSSSSPSPAFKPLPTVEIPLQDTSISSPPSPAAANLVPRSDSAADAAGSGGGDRDLPLEKLTVVLDLDETLVSAYETSSLPLSVRTKAIESGLKWFELEFFSSDKENEGETTINYVTVFERPGLREFLKQIGEFANLVLFTAGIEGYARPLVDRIDADGRFSLRLYRPSTVSTEYREHVKDLSCLSKDLCRIVIVDNNPFSFLLQPLNGIPCIPFSASQPNDDQLLQVLLPLLRYLSLQKDVRPVLYDRFHMPEWFEMHGIPASRHYAREN